MRVNLIAGKSQRKEKEEVHQINFTVRIDGQKQQERLKKEIITFVRHAILADYFVQ